MLCPRCQVPVTEGQCPSCGIVWDPEYGSEPMADTEPTVGGTIAFEVVEAASRSTASSTADWRKELRRRLEEHSGKTQQDPEAEDDAAVDSSSREEPPEADPPPEPDTPGSGDAASKLFDYQLKRPPGRRPLPNPVRRKEDKDEPARKSKARPAQRPVAREEAAASKRPKLPGETLPRPLQRKLDLESPGALQIARGLPRDTPPAAGQARPAEPRAAAPSREVLLSRFLAGIIDVTVPLALGMSFALVAAWRIGFDFFAFGSLRMALLLSLGFYLFNSIFFLLLSGQTPGMYAAQLRLIDPEGRDDIPATSIVLRVILFLPSCLTVVGLLWSIFDPERRCLHDVLSGSNVVGNNPASEDRRAPRRL